MLRGGERGLSLEVGGGGGGEGLRGRAGGNGGSLVLILLFIFSPLEGGYIFFTDLIMKIMFYIPQLVITLPYLSAPTPLHLITQSGRENDVTYEANKHRAGD